MNISRARVADILKLEDIASAHFSRLSAVYRAEVIDGAGVQHTLFSAELDDGGWCIWFADGTQSFWLWPTREKAIAGALVSGQYTEWLEGRRAKEAA